MRLEALLPGTDDYSDDGSRDLTGSVTTRLESGTDAVGELASQARETASDRATAAVERTVDELLERSLDRDGAELLDGSTVEGGVGTGAPAFEDPADRALENFLRRYGLDEDRLDERTLETIRSRLAAAGAEPRSSDPTQRDGGPRSLGSAVALAVAATTLLSDDGGVDPAVANLATTHNGARPHPGDRRVVGPAVDRTRRRADPLDGRLRSA